MQNRKRMKSNTLTKLTRMSLIGASMMMFLMMILARPVMAATCPDGSVAETLADCNVPEESDTLMPTILGIIRVVLGVLGFVAAVMIILGGVQYMTSAGDSAKAAKAKNTIMFAVVGLVISLLAFAIVNFVLADILN